MASVSSDVASGDTILASDYNNLRDDATHITLGHLHTGDTDEGGILVNNGVAASRPAAGQKKRVYISTDTFVIEQDNGITWDVLGYLVPSSHIEAKAATGGPTVSVTWTTAFTATPKVAIALVQATASGDNRVDSASTTGATLSKSGTHTHNIIAVLAT